MISHTFSTVNLLIIALLLAVVLPVGVQAQASTILQAAPNDDFQIEILHSDRHSIRLSFTIDKYQLNRDDHAQELYDRVEVQGMSHTQRSGAPQLPTHSVLLGVPTNSPATVRIIESDIELLGNVQIGPASTTEAVGDPFASQLKSITRIVHAPDTEIYGQNAFYPASPVTLEEQGKLRDQAVVQLRLTPAQINPVTRELRIYRRLAVEVAWPNSDPNDHAGVNAVQATSLAVANSPAIESLLSSTLINYEDVRGKGRQDPIQVAITNPAMKQDAVQKASVKQDDRSIATSLDTPLQLKLTIHDEGIYLITYPDLIQAGFDPAGIDPTRFQIRKNGEAVAIIVGGAEDGAFDSGDVILFYGQAYRDRYTDHNIYGLSVGDTAGRRMASRDVTPSFSLPAASPFPQLTHAEKDTAYWQDMPGRNVDRWFWETRLSPNSRGLNSSRKYEIDLGKTDTGEANATVRVMLQGYTGLAHQTRIRLNGTVIGEQTWSGQVPFEMVMPVSQTELRQGTNEIEVETLDSGAQVDQILVNWIEIEHLRVYEAEEQRLHFKAPSAGEHQFILNGLSASPTWILDVTNASAPVILSGVVNSNEQLIFEDATTEASQYVAFAGERLMRPQSVALDASSNWRSTSNGADYIIITHEAFYEAANQLAAYHAASGLRPAVVGIHDVYDEFSFGRFNPEAIRSFLAHAYANWQPPAPTYVLLLGDASQDYKGSLNTGTINYVPSQNFDSELFGEVSSDNLFATVSGEDALPDLFIGRLPAQSAAEALAMVQKVIAYDTIPRDQPWNSRVSFVADDAEDIFAEMSEELLARFPHYYTPNRLYLESGAVTNPKASIVDSFNSGSLLVSYVGHGEHFGWGINGRQGGQIFEAGDVASLTNAANPAIVVVGNCLNGFFAGPKDSPSLAEVLLRHGNGGAAAVWAPTSLGYSSGHRILHGYFYDAIFYHDQIDLGSATTKAKIDTYSENSYWQELINTFVLFGDPATQFAMTANYPFVTNLSPESGSIELPLDQPIEIAFNKPILTDTIRLIAEPKNVNGAVASLDSSIVFTPTWNEEGTQGTFTHSGFTHNTPYSFSVSGSDRLGNTIGPGLVNTPWQLTSTTDMLAPSVIITTHTGNSNEILTTTPLLLNFDEPVRPESVTFQIRPRIRGQLSWNSERTVATFSHSNFEVDQSYTFEILRARDDAGNWMTQSVAGTFVTEETNYIMMPVWLSQ